MPDFATFIAKLPGAADFGTWRRRIAFGDALPSRRCSSFLHLEVDDPAETALFAAFSGAVSTRQPSGFLEQRGESTPDAATLLDPPTVTLYLKPTAAKLNASWLAVSSAISMRFTEAVAPSIKADAIGYFEYRGVDTARAKELLGPLLRSKNKPGGAPVGDDTLWRRFLSGEGAITVAAGEEIGRAGPGSGAARQIAIGFRTRFGTYDPGLFYEEVDAALGGAAPVDAALLAQTLLQSPRPLIGPARSVDDVGDDRLWPWSALLEYRLANTLAYSDWRLLGNLQKNIYRTQLLARIRPALAPPNTPRFEYDVDDMKNVFQLEAVAEFYMNLREPWDDASNPVEPGPNYRAVNFLSLYGLNAEVAGTDVVLDDHFDPALDMGRVMPGRDSIVLASDAARPRKQYRIMAVDRALGRISVDEPPEAAGGVSGWYIYDTPTLVLIDAFGSRTRGARALGNGADTITLDQLTDAQIAELAKVERNRAGEVTKVTCTVNKWDTVDLPDAALAAHRRARIIAKPTVDPLARTAILKLDRPVNLPIAGSAWAIPAGVGAVQQAQIIREEGEKVLTPSKPASEGYGWDHYDGMMFVVAGGEIRAFFPWTSMSSRATPGGKTKFQSSIKGNTLYRYGSAFSTNEYINIAFRVVDVDGFLWGDSATTSVVPDVGRVLITPNLPLRPEIVFDPQLHPEFFTAPSFVGRLQFLTSDAPHIRAARFKSFDPANNRIRVVDADAVNVPAAASPFWLWMHAGVREARYYYTDNLESDSCGADEVPAVGLSQPRANGDTQGGKSGIFIHLGGINTNSSHGCQTSPAFMSLRVALMAYHEESDGWFYEQTSDRPRFRGEVHWDAHTPALLNHFIKLNAELTTLQAELMVAVTSPMKTALEAALGKTEGRHPKLKELKAAIKKLDDHPGGATDSGDGPTQQDLMNALQAVVGNVADDEVIALLKEEQARLTAEIKLRASPLRLKVAERSSQIGAEIASYGWNDAIHGEFWVIRPDERNH